jgi:predicted DNA-binding WGR domain protein
VVKTVQQRWIHDEKRRYYGVFLQQDLFGDWTLVRNWGSLDNGRGQLHRDAVPDRVSGLRQIAEIQRRRRAHGYRLVYGDA